MSFVSSHSPGVGLSKVAYDFNFSEESMPPKLSTGLRWGSCRAVELMEDAKSSSQLSSCVASGERKASGFVRELGGGKSVLIGSGTDATGLFICSSLEGSGLPEPGLCSLRPEPFGDFSASFHCCTLFTASSYFVGFPGTTSSDLFAFSIQGCFSSFFADTLKLGSFWKHCIKKSWTV